MVSVTFASKNLVSKVAEKASTEAEPLVSVNVTAFFLMAKILMVAFKATFANALPVKIERRTDVPFEKSGSSVTLPT